MTTVTHGAEHGLDAAAIYVAPSGRLVRWVPLGGAYRYYTERAFFAYVDQPRRLGEPEGFTLTRANYHLLTRKDGAHVAAH